MNNLIERVSLLSLLLLVHGTQAMEVEVVSSLQSTRPLALTIQTELNDDFIKAVTSRDLKAAQVALKRGAQIRECNPLILFFRSFSSGQAVVEMNKHDHAMVTWLARNGAPVNPLEGNALFNPLVFALQKCSLGCCLEALLNAGAHPIVDTIDFAQEPFVQQPVCTAIAAGNIDQVKILFKHGARANCKAAHGRTPLHCLFHAKHITLEQKKSMISFLIAKGADNNALSDEGFAPLHEAILVADRDAVACLLEQEVSANLPTLLQESPLHFALAKYGCLYAVSTTKDVSYYEIIKELVKHGADVHATNTLGCSALHMAASYGCTDMLKLLLSGVGGDGLCQTHQGDLVHTILDAQLRSKQKVALIHVLSQAGASFKAHDELGFSPLTKAINKVDLASVEALLCHGADALDPDQKKRLPLELAHRKVITSQNQNATLIVERLQEYLDGRRQPVFVGRNQ